MHRIIFYNPNYFTTQKKKNVTVNSITNLDTKRKLSFQVSNNALQRARPLSTEYSSVHFPQLALSPLPTTFGLVEGAGLTEFFYISPDGLALVDQVSDQIRSVKKIPHMRIMCIVTPIKLTWY